MSILDSGSRTEFPSGAVRDMGGKDKGRCDLMPLDVVAWMLGEVDADEVVYAIYKFTTDGNITSLHYALESFRNMWGLDMETMLLEVSVHYFEGCEKYGEDNWKKGIPVKSYINSGVRHYLKWLRGDTDERHDRAFVWNIMCAIWTCNHKPELNSYGVKECPVCGEPLPVEAKFCDYCRVHIAKEYDPENLMGEYEEENE